MIIETEKLRKEIIQFIATNGSATICQLVVDRFQLKQEKCQTIQLSGDDYRFEEGSVTFIVPKDKREDVLLFLQELGNVINYLSVNDYIRTLSTGSFCPLFTEDDNFSSGKKRVFYEAFDVDRKLNKLVLYATDKLTAYIQNNYTTTEQQNLKSEKRDRRVSQAITIIVAFASILASTIQICSNTRQNKLQDSNEGQIPTANKIAIKDRDARDDKIKQIPQTLKVDTTTTVVDTLK